MKRYPVKYRAPKETARVMRVRHGPEGAYRAARALAADADNERVEYWARVIAELEIPHQEAA
jgi:hypothetical protein